MGYQLIPRKRKNSGFTLVELIVVLALLGMVLAGIYTLFDYTQNVYSRTERQGILQDDLNKAVQQIGKDIRGAIKPNKSTKAVVIKDSGQGMDIYTYDTAQGKYYRISYRIDPTNTYLQRGTVSTNIKNETANPSYGTISDSSYVNLLEGIVTTDGGSSLTIFSDVTSSFTTDLLYPEKPATDPTNGPVDKRIIQFNIKIRDPEGHIQNPLELPMYFTTRTKGV